VRSAINVTPLVDVVLVLLIIFMVVAPVLQQGPDVEPPATERPPVDAADGRRILVALDRQGTTWVDNHPVDAALFAERMREMSREHAGGEVLLQGDAALSFGAVKRTMLAVEASGFQGVRLIAERQDPAAPGAD
jgi:biopolymer transport protein ExbD/biopolymer transport protein TolR